MKPHWLCTISRLQAGNPPYLTFISTLPRRQKSIKPPLSPLTTRKTATSTPGKRTRWSRESWPPSFPSSSCCKHRDPPRFSRNRAPRPSIASAWLAPWKFRLSAGACWAEPRPLCSWKKEYWRWSVDEAKGSFCRWIILFSQRYVVRRSWILIAIVKEITDICRHCSWQSTFGRATNKADTKSGFRLSIILQINGDNRIWVA